MDNSSEPFDEFGHPAASVQDVRRDLFPSWLRASLRAASSAFRWIALLTMGYILVRHALPLLIGSQPAYALKSAVPLIAIGVSYITLIVTLRRTPGQRVVGLSVGLAFILWGAEQFLENRAIIAFIDDVVVFLFVLDIAIVVRHHLADGSGGNP